MSYISKAGPGPECARIGATELPIEHSPVRAKVNPNEELLSPSLRADTPPAASIYSVRTGFLATFFGGPIAGAVVALVNARRLGRLGRDWPIALLGFAATTVLAWASSPGEGWLNRQLGDSGHLLWQLLGFSFYGVVYAVHRTYYRSMAIVGIKPPNGLRLGLGAAILGFGVSACEQALFA